MNAIGSETAWDETADEASQRPGRLSVSGEDNGRVPSIETHRAESFGPEPKISRLWGIVRRGPNRAARGWAAAELICIAVSWPILLLLVIAAWLDWTGVSLPRGVHAALAILGAAAVGYITNFFAVEMLFKPYERRQGGVFRLLPWKQGLIPARKAELARAVARETAEKLLTPAAITDEITQLLSGALDDPKVQNSLREWLGPLVREQLPTLIDHLTPEILSLLRAGLRDVVQPDRLKELIEQVLAPLVTAPSSRDALVGKIVQFLKSHTPALVAYLRESSARYARSGWLRRLFVGAAELFGALDWNDVRRVLDAQIASRESRERIMNFLASSLSRLGDLIGQSDLAPTMAQLKTRASDYLGRFVEQMLAAKLPDVGHRLLDSPRFWNWLTLEGVPAVKPHLIAWLERHGEELVGKRFDVAGRIQDAIDRMDVAAMHAMADRVATEQLGAIQVLGFVLGLVMGLPIALL